jgi:hypothetical protein
VEVLPWTDETRERPRGKHSRGKIPISVWDINPLKVEIRIQRYLKFSSHLAINTACALQERND